MVKKIILWVLVISCMAAIFMFSNQPSEESNDLSSSFLYEILNIFNFFKNMPRSGQMETVEMLHVFVRKAAHFSIYALLSFLTYFLVYTGYGMRDKKRMIIPPVFCACYAVTDEIHQLFIPGRSGQITDVMLDTTGAVAGMLVAMGICIIFSRRRKNG